MLSQRFFYLIFLHFTLALPSCSKYEADSSDVKFGVSRDALELSLLRSLAKKGELTICVQNFGKVDAEIVKHRKADTVIALQSWNDALWTGDKDFWPHESIKVSFSEKTDCKDLSEAKSDFRIKLFATSEDFRKEYGKVIDAFVKNDDKKGPVQSGFVEASFGNMHERTVALSALSTNREKGESAGKIAHETGHLFGLSDSYAIPKMQAPIAQPEGVMNNKGSLMLPENHPVLRDEGLGIRAIWQGIRDKKLTCPRSYLESKEKLNAFENTFCAPAFHETMFVIHNSAAMSEDRLKAIIKEIKGWISERAKVAELEEDSEILAITAKMQLSVVYTSEFGDTLKKNSLQDFLKVSKDSAEKFADHSITIESQKVNFSAAQWDRLLRHLPERVAIFSEEDFDEKSWKKIAEISQNFRLDDVAVYSTNSELAKSAKKYKIRSPKKFY